VETIKTADMQLYGYRPKSVTAGLSRGSAAKVAYAAIVALYKMNLTITFTRT